MPKVYKYKLPHGYYIGPVNNYGHAVINTVDKAPDEDEIANGFWPRWPVENPNANDWEYVENLKGESGYVDGEPCNIIDYGPPPADWRKTPPPPTIAEAKAQKWAEIVAGQTAAMGVAKAAYPDDEREGWPFKLPEAEAVLAGQGGETPYLDAELVGAGGLYQSKEELAQKIVVNNAAFKALHGFINGQQTAMYHALNQLAARPGVTSAEVLAMPVKYTMPEGF